ncbi:hypothetical protein BDQ12DRAFT_223722 [Crucibulum laeve]|uniref:Uncharacterized protein n=1 Tax=Crucibulum laeve TaxID=68775 RepID=A0A5C3LGH8_9AGAR|nr:hypothetical protein BDQ12DRAFT_223722 [Crucibulum laeve]
MLRYMLMNRPGRCECAVDWIGDHEAVIRRKTLYPSFLVNSYTTLLLVNSFHRAPHSVQRTVTHRTLLPIELTPTRLSSSRTHASADEGFSASGNEPTGTGEPVSVSVISEKQRDKNEIVKKSTMTIVSAHLLRQFDVIALAPRGTPQTVRYLLPLQLLSHQQP